MIEYDQNIEDFRSLAIRTHGDQRYGQYPYSYHLAQVESILSKNGFTDYEYRAAAWLHDTMEDCNIAAKDIMGLYGERVAQLVWGCTGVGANRKERAQCIYDRIAQYPDAAVVKVADRIANMRFGATNGHLDKVAMYVKEFPAFTEGVRKHMMEDRQKALLWSLLEDIVEAAERMLITKGFTAKVVPAK